MVLSEGIYSGQTSFTYRVEGGCIGNSIEAWPTQWYYPIRDIGKKFTIEEERLSYPIEMRGLRPFY